MRCVCLLTVGVLASCGRRADNSGRDKPEIDDRVRATEKPVPGVPWAERSPEAKVAYLLEPLCRRQVECGVGSAADCEVVARGVAALPKDIDDNSLLPCNHFDPGAAMTCTLELERLPCTIKLVSLDAARLNFVAAGIPSCRMACM